MCECLSQDWKYFHHNILKKKWNPDSYSSRRNMWLQKIPWFIDYVVAKQWGMVCAREVDQEQVKRDPLFWYSIFIPSITLVDLFCLHVMQWCFVCVRESLGSSGFINGNGIRFTQACPISIIPWSFIAFGKKKKRKASALSIFCCFCTAPDYPTTGQACFTIFFNFILPSTI